MILSMPIDQQTQAWRRVRGHSVSMLAAKSGLTDQVVEAAESGELDPPASMIEALAARRLSEISDRHEVVSV